MSPEHLWGYPVPQGPCLVPQEKSSVTTKGTCTTGPGDCCWRTMCCFDKDKCKPQPSAAPCQAGTHRRVEVQTPRVGKRAEQAAAGRGRGDEGAPADSQAGEGCRAGKGTETLHVDHEDAGFFRCCFSSSGKVPKGDKGQQGVEGLLLPKSVSVLGLVPR